MDENKESLANLRANLEEYDLKLDEIPWVIQYNKRDLANVYTIEELDRELNPGRKVPSFEAVATQGKGVFETFRGISHLLMEKVTRELRRAPMSGHTRAAKTEDTAARPATSDPSPLAAAAPPPPARTTSPTPPTPAKPAAPAPALEMTSPFASSAPGTVASPGPASGEVDGGFVFHYGRELSLTSPGGSTDEVAGPPPLAESGDLELSPEPPSPFTSEPPAVRPITVAAETRSTQVSSDVRGSVGVMRESLLNLSESSSTPARPSVAAPELAIERESGRSAAHAGNTEVVVPVSIPRGATREIVLKIVITHEAA
jgi:hypothetical protein